MSEALSALFKRRGIGDVLTHCMNFTEQPQRRYGSPMKNAWQRTGRHIRKAMTDYGGKQEITIRGERAQKKPDYSK